MMEAQSIEINIYPFGNAYSVPRDTTAYVSGNWAAHLTFHEEAKGVGGAEWSITHLPSGAIAFVGAELDTMIEVARRLDALEQPTVEVESNGADMPIVVPLSMAWIRKVAKLLSGLDVFAVSGTDLVPPAKLVRHMTKKYKEPA
jgi:hypothetical protein